MLSLIRRRRPGTGAQRMIAAGILPAALAVACPQSDDARKAIEAQYRRMDARFVQARRFDVAFTKDARIVDMAKRERPASQDVNTMQPLFGRGGTASARTAIESIDVEGNGATAVARTILSATQLEPGSPDRIAAIEFVFKDSWVRQAETWLIRRREYTGARLTVDGKTILNALPPPELTGEARAAVVKEIGERAIPLSTTDPSAPLDDLSGLDRAIGSARIVAVGEGSHGVLEFDRIKRRIVRYLVERKGFSVVALESCWDDPEPIERAVQNPNADVEKAVNAAWEGWESQEDLDFVRWARDYNAHRGNHPGLTITSMDLLANTHSLPRLRRYARRLAPAESAALLIRLKAAEPDAERNSGEGRWKKENERCRRRAEQLVAWMDHHRAVCEHEAGVTEFRHARHAARLLWQVCDTQVGPFWSTRDRAMAENVKWLADEEYPGQKIVVLAHNGHVSRESIAVFGPMGGYLSDRFGPRLVIVGTTFYEGGIRVFSEDRGWRSKEDRVVHRVPPARAGSLEAILHEAGRSLYALDLRRLPASGALRKWLSQPVSHRTIGNAYALSAEKNHYVSVDLPRAFDVMIYMEKTHPLK